MKTKTIKQDKVNVITLGCSKNLVDSENIITQLRGNDYEVVHDSNDEDANVVIVNTCGFIDLAKEESVNTILEYAEEKKQGNIEKLYVTGCLSQRYKDDLEQEIPEVDAYFGTLELPALLSRLNADYKHELIGERAIMTPFHYAYLKISEGCNRTCSFCAIPLMRGKHISKSIEDLVKEAQSLGQKRRQRVDAHRSGTDLLRTGYLQRESSAPLTTRPGGCRGHRMDPPALCVSFQVSVGNI
jgi:ribosomal protein S12 methylthiotransferase